MTGMRITILILFSLLFVMCKSKQAATETKVSDNDIKTEAKSNVQYRDDFRSVSNKEKEVFLKKLKAEAKNYSVLIFTRGYKGEGIQVSNAAKIMYSGNVISNLKTGIGHYIRIDNTVDTKVFDSFTKKSIILEAEEVKKHKFIYLMKDSSNKSQPFSITYSNTLRPLGSTFSLSENLFSIFTI